MIIKSILDTDLYKLTMMNAVLSLFPNTEVSYKFKNRGKHRFDNIFLETLKKEIISMGNLRLTDEEYSWLKDNVPFFKPTYLEYLKNFRFDPTQVETNLDDDNNLVLDITGPWHSTILWEVPLMALISELYFSIVDKNWDMTGQKENAFRKGNRLAQAGCVFADFGTRRRRSFETQRLLVETMKAFNSEAWSKRFVGTSNVALAKMYNLKAIGTMAHEWFMGTSVLEGLRNANYYALTNWKRVYTGSLGIALTDTYGTAAFLNNFTLELAKLYDGVRHDSGDPFKFADIIIEHYKKLGIDPTTKTIIFSDGLDVDTAEKIYEYCKGKIRLSFGIGTHFTNDFGPESPALNMVIKLWSVWHNGMEVPVVKLSDSYGKVMGDPNAVAVAEWMFHNKQILR